MANPNIPIQQAGNLPALDFKKDEEVKKEQLQEEEISELEQKLGLDESETEGEIIELEDGSVIINMEQTKGPKDSPKFYENLAESLDDSTLDQLANDYLDFIDNDQDARKTRDKQYEEGLRRTGLGKDAPGGATFDGASKVVHPVMAESCVDFAASSAKELLPPEGIVKANIKGTDNKDKLEIAERKANFLNWQLTEQIPEYRDEMEQLLTQLP